MQTEVTTSDCIVSCALRLVVTLETLGSLIQPSRCKQLYQTYFPTIYNCI